MEILYVKKITKTEKRQKGETTEKFSTILQNPEESMTMTIKETDECSFELGEEWSFERKSVQSKIKG